MIFQDRWENAVHEAAHAVIAHVLNADKVKSMHVFNDIGGVTAFEYDDSWTDARNKIESVILYSMAGRLAAVKARFVPWTVTGDNQANISEHFPPEIEKERSAKLHEIIFGNDDDSDWQYEDKLARKLYPDSFEEHLQVLYHRAQALVEMHWPLIQSVAKSLFHRSYLSGAEFLDIVKA